MENLDSALCQWNAQCTHYLNLQFSYLHTFYKPNNKTKSSAKVKSYFQIWLDKETEKYSTLDSYEA